MAETVLLVIGTQLEKVQTVSEHSYTYFVTLHVKSSQLLQIYSILIAKLLNRPTTKNIMFVQLTVRFVTHNIKVSRCRIFLIVDFFYC